MGTDCWWMSVDFSCDCTYWTLEGDVIPCVGLEVLWKNLSIKLLFFLLSFIVFVVLSCSSTDNDRIHIRIMLGEESLMSLPLTLWAVFIQHPVVLWQQQHTHLAHLLCTNRKRTTAWQYVYDLYPPWPVAPSLAPVVCDPPPLLLPHTLTQKCFCG